MNVDRKSWTCYRWLVLLCVATLLIIALASYSFSVSARPEFGEPCEECHESPQGGNGGGCLVATATYSSELSPIVQFLRTFRDTKVLATFPGSQFMKTFNLWYYSFSPSVANVIASTSVLKNFMKVFLYPLMGILRVTEMVYSTLFFVPNLAIISSMIVASSLTGLVYATPGLIVVLSKMRNLDKLVILPQLCGILLGGSLLMVLYAQIAHIHILMMASTVSLVLSTIGLFSFYGALRIRRFLDAAQIRL